MKVFLFLLSLLRFGFGFSQQRFEKDARELINSGICDKLIGEIGVFPIYIYESELDTINNKGLIDSIRKACQWLESTGELNKINLNISVFEELNKFKIPKGSNYYSPWEFSYGYDNRFLFVDSLKNEFQVEKVVLIFLYLGKGIRQAFNVELKGEVEYIIFSSLGNKGLPDPYPSVFAHEILHLFGALDLFYSGNNSKNSQFIKGKYPYEIMLWPDSRISFNYFSEVTLYLIGWRNNLPKELFFLLNRDG